jgi:aldehyde dehydrogenase (NAD+)/betaine-aldehyde dehydrogenase
MRDKLFIGGEFVDGVEQATFEVLNPHDLSRLAEVAEAREADVDRAVAAAAAAFGAWSRTPASERGRLLLRLADAIEANAAELARLETLDTGHPIAHSTMLDAPRTAATFRYFGGMADKYEGTVVPVETGFLNYVVRRPVGVVGQIVPWNFPLMFTSWKLGPALAAGNTVVMKPAELTPLTTLAVAELIAGAGFPPGVVNVVPGFGHVAGARLAEHPGVAKLSFTGSTEVGRRIDLAAAVQGSAFAIFHNQGQACIAGSRLLLHHRIAEEFLDRFLALARSIRLGDPLDPATEMGPPTSPEHRQRLLGYVKPTVVRARPELRVNREEVFGPFVTVATFDGDDEAVAMANATAYGLGGGLWTRDLRRAHRVADAIRSGMVWVNSYKRVHPGSPFGGVGESGYGREMGFEAMHGYTDPKSVWVNVDATVPPFYRREDPRG